MSGKDAMKGLTHDFSVKEDETVSRLPTEADWYNIDVDKVWHDLERLGTYQRTQLVFLSFLSICFAHVPLGGIFAGKLINFSCASDKDGAFNNTSEVSSCNIHNIYNNTSKDVTQEVCTEFDYGGGGNTLSYIAEWDLVCDKETLGQLPQILTMVGMFVGAGTLPHLGDRFGRKKLLIGASTGMFFSLLSLSFVQQFELFLVLNFSSGAFQQGLAVVAFTMMVEVTPLELGSFVTLLATLIWIVSMSLVGVVGYLLRDQDWRMLQLVLALSTLPSIMSIVFLDETLRWLLGNSRTKEADEILRKACRKNQKDYNALMNQVLNQERRIEDLDKAELKSSVDICDDVMEIGVNDVNNEVKSREIVGNSHKLKAILFSSSMRRIAFVMCYSWMIVSMTYYGLTLLSTSLAGDPYVNYFLTSLVDLPSAFLMYSMLQKFGRKRSVIISNLISGLSLLMAVLVAQFARSSRLFLILRTCMTLVGKFFIAISFNTLWIYAPELYPTNLRNFGVGLSSSSARIGAAFSPLFTLLARKVVWAPGVLFTIGIFISVFLLTLIPETRWRELPKNIKEIDQWFNKDKHLQRLTNGDESKDDACTHSINLLA